MRQNIFWVLLVIFTFSVAVAQENDDILFEDSFESDNLGQWRYDSNLSFEFIEEFENTFLSITSEDNWVNISSIDGDNWDNYSLQFRFRIIDFDENSATPHFFFESRSTTRGTYSGFIWLRESGSYMGLGGPLDGEWGKLLIEQLDFDAPANPQVATWHDIEMIVNANIIDLYFDGVLHGQYSSPDLERGRIGFGLAPGGNVHIDDVKVTTVDGIEPVEITEVVESTIEILDDSVIVDGEEIPFSTALINPLTGEEIQPGIYEPRDILDETRAEYFNYYVCPGCVTWDSSRVQLIEPIVIAGYVGRTEGIVFNRRQVQVYEVIIPAENGIGWATAYISIRLSNPEWTLPGTRVILADIQTGEAGVYGGRDGNYRVQENGIVRTWSSSLDSGEFALFVIDVGSGGEDNTYEEQREEIWNRLQNAEVGQQIMGLSASDIIIAQDELPINAEVTVTSSANVNIRSEPNTRSSVVGRSVANESLTVIGEVLNGEIPSLGNADERTGIWYEIETAQGVIGYVWSGLMNEPIITFITDSPDN